MHFRDIGHLGPEASVRVGHSLVKFEHIFYGKKLQSKTLTTLSQYK